VGVSPKEVTPAHKSGASYDEARVFYFFQAMYKPGVKCPVANLSFDAPLDSDSKTWKTPEQWEKVGRGWIASAKKDSKGRVHIDDTYDIAEAEAKHQEWLKSGMPF
jgi:hypothetical protein